VHDEELRAVGVRAGVRHRQRAHPVAVGPRGLQFVAKRYPGPPRPGAGRVAALDHEPFDHAVEDHPVVEALARQEHEVVDRVRGLVGEQLRTVMSPLLVFSVAV
jgi:hypothetical protein